MGAPKAVQGKHGPFYPHHVCMCPFGLQSWVLLRERGFGGRLLTFAYFAVARAVSLGSVWPHAASVGLR